MASNNRRTSQIPQMRRSSSIDAFSSQNQILNPNGNRLFGEPVGKITGRSSSIDASQRQSVIGRPSIARQSVANGLARPSIGTALKQAESHDIAREIIRILMDLDFKQFSIKDLLTPSSSTFYQVFEFLMKQLGLGNDIWNAEILIKRNHLAENPKNKNQQSSSQQPATGQAQIIAQNKARVDLIIFYLTIFKFNNIPKANVLQTMTTPKNWSHMLQILYFLANNCWFLMIYGSERIMKSLDPNFDNSLIIYNYLKEAYKTRIEDASFLGSSKHMQMKNEFYKKYKEQIIGESNLEELAIIRDTRQKEYEQAIEQRKAFDDALKNEQELIRLCNEEERSLNLEKIQTEEAKKRVKIVKINVNEKKEKLQQMESEISLKDAEYDKQLASGKSMDNLVNRHAQKVQHLDNLQNTYVELCRHKDDIQSKLIGKASEVLDKISVINDIVNKIKLNSPIAISEFPHFDLLDFHKKSDLIKQYKDSLLEIRKDYNANMCKLPEILSHCREKKKLAESKVDNYRTKNKAIEQEIVKTELVKQSLKKEFEETMAILNIQLNNSRNDYSETLKIKQDLMDERKQREKKLQEAKHEAILINNDLDLEISNSKEKATQACTNANENLEITEREMVADLNDKMNQIKQITEMINKTRETFRKQKR